ncbi:hypothetical protein FRC09_011316 [Ceratobasidium sp. 395]|nr:hypothetical protein FRC09_011316 [Ceratobasidium sp. 395]
MSAILEHFKPPPLASDPPAKTKFWPAPPTQSSGGILQRPQPVTNISISSSSSQLSVPSVPPTPLSPPASTRVSFAPLPDVTERKRRNSITLGVAARSAALRQMKERAQGPPGAESPRPGPQSRPPGGGGGVGPGKPRYVYPGTPAGRPRPRRPVYKDDDVRVSAYQTPILVPWALFTNPVPPRFGQVVDLGEVAMDAGKKLWRVINKKSRKSSGAASDSGRPDVVRVVADDLSVGGPTVGVSGHNTEREILVRGFAVPEDVPDVDEGAEERDEEEEREHVHRTEDYVADMQAMRIYDNPDPSETFAVDPSAVSPTGSKDANSLSPGHLHSTTHSPPPLTPESETSELLSSDSSSAVSNRTPILDPHILNTSPDSGQLTTKSSLF